MNKNKKKKIKNLKFQNYLDIKIEKDTWSLDVAFVRWINGRLKAYFNYADSIVDLEYDKFNYKDKEVSLRWCILRMIELSDICLKSDPCEVAFNSAEEELYELWALTRRAVWW